MPSKLKQLFSRKKPTPPVTIVQDGSYFYPYFTTAEVHVEQSPPVKMRKRGLFKKSSKSTPVDFGTPSYVRVVSDYEGYDGSYLGYPITSLSQFADGTTPY
ncbi:hypothetical protein ACOME3_007908 [Neoechinorhynchus agilis]